MADVTYNLASGADAGCPGDRGLYRQPFGQSAAGIIAPGRGTDNRVAGAPAEIVAIYTGACANCHNDRDDVGPSKAISLSLSTAVRRNRVR